MSSPISSISASLPPIPAKLTRDPRYPLPVLNYTTNQPYSYPAIYCAVCCIKSPQSPAVATIACFLRQQYLCDKCDHATAVKPPSAGQFKFPVSQLKSYVAFDFPRKAGDSHIRRNLLTPSSSAMATFNGCGTLYETFFRAVASYPNALAVGRRTANDAQGKPGPYEWFTYKQLGEKVTNFAAGLYQFGLEPKAKIGLYAPNRMEWPIAEYACYCHSYLAVPLYDTLGVDAAEQVIRHSGISLVVCSADKIPHVLEIASRFDTLRGAIVLPPQAFDPPAKAPAKHVEKPPHFRLLNFADIERNGAAASPAAVRHTPPQPDDLCTLCFTSGTTGVPKGAMLTHANLVSNYTSLLVQGGPSALHLAPGDLHVSFLPLAHMFERLTHAAFLSLGVTIAYARPSPLTLVEDVETVRPTIFVAVPRLYNRLYDRIKAAVAAQGGVKHWLFNTAYKAKLTNLKENNSVKSFLWDRVVFKNVAARLGGRVSFMISGSAPISDNVMNFLRVAFSSVVCEGYGQTESTAGISITNPHEQNTNGNVGSPFVCNDVKLVDVKDMNYTVNDIVKGVFMPRGEICIRGSNQFKGYYLDPTNTKEAVDEDGWLHTGDIGAFLADGTLKIIDRKKAMFKLSQGEYIAPEKVENVYLRAKLIAQIFVYGDSLQSCLVAIIVPDEETVSATAKKLSWTGTFQDWVKSPQLKQLIQKEMEHMASVGKLTGFEQVKAIALIGELFTVENNLLTPTMKLKRNEAKKKYENLINEMYEKLGTPIEGAGQVRSKL